MRYGCCVGFEHPEYIKLLAESGYDYFEANFQRISKCSDEEFAALKGTVKEYGIKCEAANCFLPGEYKLLSKDFDLSPVIELIENGMRKGSEVGLETVVFGSGGARSLVEGVSFADGIKKLAAFLGDIVSPIAAKYGITVATEPLCREECNMINTVSEGAMLAVMSGKDNIKTIGDIYHMKKAGDTPDTIRLLGTSICHGHISCPFPKGDMKRVYMKSADEYDYRSFIDALEEVGCKRCSIEASTKDFMTDAAEAIKVLHLL